MLILMWDMYEIGIGTGTEIEIPLAFGFIFIFVFIFMKYYHERERQDHYLTHECEHVSLILFTHQEFRKSIHVPFIQLEILFGFVCGPPFSHLASCFPEFSS